LPLLSEYHRRLRHCLPDEPSGLEPEDLNKEMGATHRARASILGYNEIIWSRGEVHNQGTVDDLELDSAIGNENSVRGKPYPATDGKWCSGD
jgi:hypothetical protein